MSGRALICKIFLKEKRYCSFGRNILANRRLSSYNNYSDYRVRKSSREEVQEQSRILFDRTRDKEAISK